VKKATKSEIVAIVLAFISLFVVMIAGSTAVWLTSEVRVLGLVVLPAAIVAGLLVVYFDWRAKRRNRILADRDDHEKAA
jgi:Na+/glutamate symporter